MRRFENKKYYFHGYIMKPEPLIYLKQVWKKCVNSRDRQRETFFALFSKSITGKTVNLPILSVKTVTFQCQQPYDYG